MNTEPTPVPGAYEPNTTPLGAPAAPVSPQPGMPYPPAPQPPKRRHLGLIIGVAVVVLAAAGVGVGLGLTGSAGHPSPGAPAGNTASTFNVHGTLTLLDAEGVENLDGTNCTGMGGYDDIQLGAQVVITDQAGTTIAVTQLGGGRLLGSGMSRQCSFDFSAGAVPGGKSFYGITVSHRGTIQYTQAEMESGVQLSLGN